MMILYHLLWSFLLIFLIPAALVSGNRRWRERLALNLPKRPPNKDNIWVHALSVGEVLSALPLLKRLKAAFPEKDIVLSVTTRSGKLLAREKVGAELACLITMPLDGWWSTRRIIGFVRPSVFILVETDLWPGLLHFLSRKNIQSLLVNGRISPRTFSSYQKAAGVVRGMFRPLKYCLMQTDLDRDRLLALGMDPEKVVTAGNIKFDRETAVLDSAERRSWLESLGLRADATLFVAGSTHEGEETLLLSAFRALKKDFPLLQMIIAPRDVKRSREISNMISREGMTPAFRTTAKKESPLKEHRPWDVLVLDTVGELGYVYGLGILSFVGGSFVPIGGHNLLEPADYGIPVLFGPHTHNFERMSESILQAGGGVRVQDESELCDAMKRLLTDTGLRRQMGRRAKAFVAENRGAMERVLAYVSHCMPTR